MFFFNSLWDAFYMLSATTNPRLMKFLNAVIVLL